MGNPTDIRSLIDALLDRYMAAYREGREVDLAALLESAGVARYELAASIEAFVLVTPPPEPSEARVAAMRARLSGEPALLALRKDRRRRVDEIVRDLARELNVTHGGKLRDYYQRLENGTLDPQPVSARVWEALREIYGTNVRSLVRPLVTVEGSPAPAFYRRPALEGLDVRRGDDRALGLVASAASGLDEIDRLFLGDA